ncbi:putative Tc1like transporase, partial [Globisporangium splendens]
MGEPSNAQLLQSMLQLMDQQTKLMEAMKQSRDLTEIKLEGIKLPVYGGTLNESFQLYKEQVEQYFFARGIDWKSVTLTTRILAVLGGTLKQGAAQWYIVMKSEIKTVDEFFEKLQEEFVPADLQERLRDQLNELKQRQCRDIMEYVSRHRELMTQQLPLHWIMSDHINAIRRKFQDIRGSPNLAIAPSRIASNELTTGQCRWKSTMFSFHRESNADAKICAINAEKQVTACRTVEVISAILRLQEDTSLRIISKEGIRRGRI